MIAHVEKFLHLALQSLFYHNLDPLVYPFIQLCTGAAQAQLENIVLPGAWCLFCQVLRPGDPGALKNFQGPEQPLRIISMDAFGGIRINADQLCKKLLFPLFRKSFFKIFGYNILDT